MSENLDHLTREEIEELKKAFFSQAYEMLDNVEDLLLRLETDPRDGQAVNVLQRYFHTLKGDSDSIGLTAVALLCHRVEDVLSSISEGKLAVRPELTSMLLRCADRLEGLLTESEKGEEVREPSDILEMIDAFVKGQCQREPADGVEEPESQSVLVKEAISRGERVYRAWLSFHPLCEERGVGAFMVSERIRSVGSILVSLPDIDGNEIEEARSFSVIFASALDKSEIIKRLHVPGVTGDIRIEEYRPATGMEGKSVQGVSKLKSEILRVEASKVDRIMDLAGELIIDRSVLEQIARDVDMGADMDTLAARMFALNNHIGKIISELQKGIMRMRMVQINQVFRKFPRVVRELSAAVNKKIRLEMHGKETELDKGIVDALGEPLLHLVRNSIDHGIEVPEERVSKGKSEEGVITVRAYHEAAQIVIEISDDGRGIDLDKLKRKAVEKRILKDETVAGLSEGELVDIIFLPGLSTADKVTEVSGRGIGMDAVKAAVENMKGTVEVDTIRGEGTTFRLKLPLTLAVIKALLVDVCGRIYAIPVSSIKEVKRVMEDELAIVDGKETLMLRDQIISIIRLEDLFGHESRRSGKRFVLVISFGTRKAGLLVDRLIGQQELVIKPVDRNYTNEELVAGGSILGDGRVIFILNAPGIFKRAVEIEGKRTQQTWQR